jgi:predicted phage baseplate assembly protein
VLWRESLTLFGAAPRDHIFVARTEPDGRTVIRFGDGEEGARLPRGVDNIRATYRKGAGVAGNVKAGQLSMLLTRPLGVKDVINPLPATGGSDPQNQEQARANAPVTVLTLGRVVSLQDYEDFARGFPGIAKALATWTWDGRRRGVIVTVAGPAGATIAQGSPTHTSLLGALTESGDPHVAVRLVGFRPVGFRLVVNVARSPDYLKEKVEAGVREALLAAFSFDGRRLGQPVALSEVVAVMQAVPGVLGVDVDALHRPNTPAVPNARLRADAPQPGWASALGAELLTIDAAALSLTVD